ncbi:hypothetical protein LEN26_003724 [Aphanomyces euteiches]|nr:hypothetical protein LEN26_003724 [Aphanomyces euteiches]
MLSDRQRRKLMSHLDKWQSQVVHLRWKLDKCRWKQIVRAADVAKGVRLRAKEARLKAKLSKVQAEMRRECPSMLQNFEGPSLACLGAKYGLVALLDAAQARQHLEKPFDELQEAPIILATANGHFDCVQYLANHQVNVNAVNTLGQTALHVAASTHDVEILRFLLLQPRINIQVRDSNLKTPIELAQQCAAASGDKFGLYASCIQALEEKSASNPATATSTAADPPQIASTQASTTPITTTTSEQFQVHEILEVETPSTSLECVVCMDRPREAACVPCGHRVLCLTCASSLTSTRCPICRIQVQQIIRIYDN